MSLDCPHRGEDTGKRIACHPPGVDPSPSWEAKVFRCQLFEECTLGRINGTPKCCIDCDRKPPPEGPGLLRKALNLAIASAEHLAAGLPVTPDAEIERRSSICRNCVGPGGYYNPEKGTCNHNKCGCFMSVKQAWAEQRCPIGKW